MPKRIAPRTVRDAWDLYDANHTIGSTYARTPPSAAAVRSPAQGGQHARSDRTAANGRDHSVAESNPRSVPRLASAHDQRSPRLALQKFEPECRAHSPHDPCGCRQPLERARTASRLCHREQSRPPLVKRDDRARRSCQGARCSTWIGGPCIRSLAAASSTFASHPLAIATAISEGMLCRPRRTH